MQRGGTDRRDHRGRRATALALTAALVLTACQDDAGTTATGTPVAAADPGDGVPLEAPLTWDDDLDHLLVTTGPVTAEAPTAPADPAPDTTSSTMTTIAAPTSGTVVIDHADGTSMEIALPEGALTFIQPSTEAERAALDAADGGAVAVLVQDRDGAIGDPGAVYVLTPGHLTEVSNERHALMSPRAAPIEPAPVEPAITPAAGEPAATPSADPVLDALRAVDGVSSAERVAPDLVAVATAGSSADVAAVTGVVSVDEDVLLHLADDPRQYEQWWLQNLGNTAQTSGWPAVAGADSNAVAGWQVSKGSGVVVAVIDTGVDIDHPDLAAQIWNNPGETCANGVDDDGNGRVDDCHGYDFGVNDTDPRPDAGAQSTEHGTHVAGIVGAAQNGVGISGIAPQSTIMPVKVSTTSGALGLSAIVAGIRYAADEGAKVMNLSLSTGPNTPRSAMTAFEGAIAYAQSKGVLVVVAAGNNNYDIGAGPAWPANYSLYYDNVLTVAASTPSDEKASFSNYGAPINIWAPGWFILSTVPNASWSWLSGTSMAAPVVAGAAADVIASGQAVTPAAVRARLVERAEAVTVGPRLDLGAALGVNLPASVQVTYGGADALVADTPSTVGIDVVGSSLPAGTDRVRVSVAASTGTEVYAVADLPATIRTPDGAAASVTTGDDGSFAPITITDPSALATGYHLDLVVDLPAGDFAVVTELLDASGATVVSPQAGFVTVTAPVDQNPTTTAATPDTTAPGSPDTTAAPTPTAPATSAPSGGGGGSGTTQPPSTQPLGTQPGATQPPTTQPPTTQPGSQPGTTQPSAAPTTAPRTTPTTAAPGTPVTTAAPGTTTPAAPGTTQPVTTTPAPPPDVSGPWRLDTASPRSGSTTGGDRIRLQGHFPTTVPLYVWFGNLAIVQASSVDGTSIDVTVPAVNSAGVVDLSVRFTTSTTSHALSLTAAFTYVAPSGSAPGTTVPAPGTTAPAPGTTAPAPGTTAPAVPTTSAAPGTTTPAAPTTTLAPRVGNLSLRPRPTTGSLARLTISAWRTPCRTSSCPATSL